MSFTVVILLNDDARPVTPGGFTALSRQVRRQERPGIGPGARHAPDPPVFTNWVEEPAAHGA